MEKTSRGAGAIRARATVAGSAQEVERPGARARESEQADLGRCGRNPGPEQAEERRAGRVGEDDCERREDRRKMPKRELGVDVGEPRDERDRGVPDRERVAGVEASVAKLVEDVERREVECLELADPAQVEQAVAEDRARRPPDCPREHESDCGDACHGSSLGRLGGNLARA